MHIQTERILALCEEKNIKISKLESDCGFWNGYIKQVKKGYDAENLAKIASYLSTSMNYLMGIDDNPDYLNGDLLAGMALNGNLMSSIEKLLKLKPSDKDLVINLINTLYEKAEG